MGIHCAESRGDDAIAKLLNLTPRSLRLCALAAGALFFAVRDLIPLVEFILSYFFIEYVSQFEDRIGDSATPVQLCLGILTLVLYRASLRNAQSRDLHATDRSLAALFAVPAAFILLVIPPALMWAIHNIEDVSFSPFPTGHSHDYLQVGLRILRVILALAIPLALLKKIAWAPPLLLLILAVIGAYYEIWGLPLNELGYTSWVFCDPGPQSRFLDNAAFIPLSNLFGFILVHCPLHIGAMIYLIARPRWAHPAESPASPPVPAIQ